MFSMMMAEHDNNNENHNNNDSGDGDDHLDDPLQPSKHHYNSHQTNLMFKTMDR